MKIKKLIKPTGKFPEYGEGKSRYPNIYITKNNIDINQYIQYDDADSVKLYFNKDKFLEDALAYLKEDHHEHTIIIKELETVEIDIADELNLEDTSKAEIKCGANGDAFNFELSLVDVHKKGDGNRDENVFEYESDELCEWLQKIADMLGIKYPHEFNLKSIKNALPIFISQFKDGVSDALLTGKRADANLTSAYKEGYDFGITMYCEMEEDDE